MMRNKVSSIMAFFLLAMVSTANGGTLEDRLYATHMKENAQYLKPFGDWAKQEVRKNIRKDVQMLNKVISNAESVSVTKTIDTDTYVISIYDGKNSASLWLDKDWSIRSVTPY